MTRWLLPLQSFVLALVLTWPAVLHVGTAAVGSPQGDGVKHLWNLWWMRQEVLQGTSGLTTTLVNFPVGMSLYPIEPLHGLLSLLLPLPPVALANVLALLHFTLLGVCGGWLGDLVSGARRGAHVTGALLQASSFAAFTLHVGVGELRQVWWIPLGLACLHKARTSLDPRWFLALAGSLAGATLSCFYHGFFLATAVSLHALATLRPAPRLLLGYALAAGLSLAIVVPVIRTFSESYAPDEQREVMPFSAWMTRRYEVDTYPAAALDPAELLLPRANLNADRQTLAYTGGRYLGIGAFLLACVGVVAAPRRALPWLVVAAGGLLLSLGTVLWWNGAIVSLGGGRIVLPLATINRALAWAAEPMNFPARFISVTMVAIAVLGGLGASRWRAVLWLTPLALVDTTLGDLVPFPRETITLPDVVGLESADAGAAPLLPGAIADLTVFTRPAPPGGGEIGMSPLARIDPEGRTRAIAAQIALNRSFSTVPIERIDHWGPEGLFWTAALPLATALSGASASEEDLRASAWLLADAGFAGVLLTHSCHDGAPVAAGAILTQLLGAPRAGKCATVWPVSAVDAAADGPRWKEEQARRATALAPPRMGPRFAPPG